VSLVRLRPVWMTNHPPSVLWHCWLGHQTCKNRRPYNLYCVSADVKPCSINQSINQAEVIHIRSMSSVVLSCCHPWKLYKLAPINHSFNRQKR